MDEANAPIVDKIWTTEYKECGSKDRIANRIEDLIDENCDIFKDGCYNKQWVIELKIREVGNGS